jgi:hypothetical protein
VALTLMMAGAEMNVQDKDGKTALMVAIINGHQDLVELLLQRNADITVKNLVNHVLLFVSDTKIARLSFIVYLGFISYLVFSIVYPLSYVKLSVSVIWCGINPFLYSTLE